MSRRPPRSPRTTLHRKRQDRRWTTGNLDAGPTRSCLACRRRDDKASLTRITISGGTVVADPSAILPGRGAYLCHRSSCTDAALSRGATRLLKALRAAPGTTINEHELRAATQHSASSRSSRASAGRSTHSAGVSE